MWLGHKYRVSLLPLVSFSLACWVTNGWCMYRAQHYCRKVYICTGTFSVFLDLLYNSQTSPDTPKQSAVSIYKTFFWNKLIATKFPKTHLFSWLTWLINLTTLPLNNKNLTFTLNWIPHLAMLQIRITIVSFTKTSITPIQHIQLICLVITDKAPYLVQK